MNPDETLREDVLRLNKKGGESQPIATNMSNIRDSPDVSSSMQEFLTKEKLCTSNVSDKTVLSEGEREALETSLHDNLTDDDLGNIMEQLSQLTDDSSDKSVEEILKEAEELAKENAQNFKELSSSFRSMSSHSIFQAKEDETISLKQTHETLTAEGILKPHKPINANAGVDNQGTTNRVNLSSSKVCLKQEPSGDRKTSVSRAHPKQKYINVLQNTSVRKDKTKIKTNKIPNSTSHIRENKNKDIRKSIQTSKEPEQASFPSSKCLNSSESTSINLKKAEILTSHQKSKTVLKKSKTFGFEDNFPVPVRSSEYSGADFVLNETYQASHKNVDFDNIPPPESSLVLEPENVSKTKELLYQLIDKEVHSEFDAVLKESGLLTREREHSVQDSICPTDVSEQKSNESKQMLDDYAQALKDSIKLNIETKKTLSVVSEESSIDLSSNGYYGPKDKQQSNVETGNILNSQLNNLRKELLEERGKILVLKEEMESKEKHHLDKMNQLTQKYEKELFELKKDTLILTAKVTDYENQLSLKDKNGDGVMSKMFGADHRSALLEKELQQQEQLIQGCQRENIKLCQDIKHLKEEMRVKEVQFHSERQQLQAELHLVKQGTSKDDREAFIEQIKDKDEMIVKLGLEIEVLKTKVRDLQESSEDLEVLVSFMKGEVERYKNLSTNNNSRRTGSLALKSSSILNQEVDRYRSEVERQDATIKTLNHDLELARDSLEAKKNELIAVVSESRLQLETLEMRLCDIQATLKKERMEAKKYALEKEEDKKTVKDLTRQVREMERILKRNHPNSISALILTANSDVEAGGTSPRVKYLENRIQQLEQELQAKETEAASSFQKIQDQFHSMKSKYEAHIADLELELAAAKHQANMRKLAAEKAEPTEARTQIVNNKDLQPPSSKAPKKQPTYAPQTCHSTALSLNAISVKEDTHLIATIRGLHSEMSLKEREIHKLGKELEEAKRMVRKLQKDRDRLLDKDTNNLVKGTRTKANSKNDKTEPALEDKGLDVDSQSSLKPYDPVRFQFPQDGEEGISALRQQNQILRRDLLQIEEEYRRLKTKRMQDLNLLQQQHELEMEQVVSEHMARHSGSRIAELQGQLGTQRMVIAQLKEQLKQLDEYREEIVVLKTERNLLEKSAIELNKKLTTLRSLQTPEALHYEALQDKIQELESRHEFREQKLQAVVKDLLRRNAEQRAHLAEREQNGNSVNLREKLMDKNRELCLYQAEMDRILDTLRSLYRCREPNNFSE
nr:unnamed protein product [Timema poppensis]